MVRIAVHRSVVARLGVLVTPFDPGDAEAVVGGADHAGDVDRDLDFTDLGERIVGARVIVERDRAPVGDEVISREPVLAHDDRVGRDGSNVLDETRQMPGDLRIGRPVVRNRGGDRLRLAEFVDLDHPGCDGATGSLPDHAAGETRGEKQIAERDQPPVARLDTGRADALVPDLGSLLIWRLRLWGAAVADRGTTKHQWSSFRRRKAFIRKWRPRHKAYRSAN
jgi:hypothetical protein